MNKDKMPGFLRLGVLAALLVACGVAGAEADSENIIKYRRSTMKAMGGHMGAMAQIVRAKVDYKDHLALHSESVAAISKTVLELFPEGSDFGDTRAKEEIWEKWDTFQKAADEAQEASGEFVEAVKGGDDATIGRSFRSLTDTCKNCHKKFREKED